MANDSPAAGSSNAAIPRKPQDRNRAILRSTLEPEARLVALAIADHMDAAGEAWPSADTLATETGYSERTVRDVLTHGIETGWLAFRWRPGRIRVLRVAWDRLADTDRATRNAGTRRVRRADDVSDVSDPERGAGSIRNGAPEREPFDPAPAAGSIRNGAPVDPERGAGSIRNGAPMKQTSEAIRKQTSEATSDGVDLIPFPPAGLFPGIAPATIDAPPATDPIDEAWTALVAWTPKPAAWKLSPPRRTKLKALVKQHGIDAIHTVAHWMTSEHDRARFLRDRGDADTLIRPANFATYLALAETNHTPQRSPAQRGAPVDYDALYEQFDIRSPHAK